MTPMFEPDLLHYVNLLRQPHRTPHMQQNDAGIKCISFSTHDALLTRLRSAVIGGIGAHEGSSSSGSQRLPFDPGADALYKRIETQISVAFVELTQQPVYLYPERTVYEWYLAHVDGVAKGTITPEADADALRTARGWCEQIEAKFDPVRVREMTSPCPSCDETYAFDPDSGDQIRAFVFEYRYDDHDVIIPIGMRCRFCETFWPGYGGSRAAMKLITAGEREAALVESLIIPDTPVESHARAQD